MSEPTITREASSSACAWDDETRIAINGDAEARIAALEASLPFAISRHLSTICSHLLGLYDASADPKVRELAVAIRACTAEAGEAFAAAMGAKASQTDALAKLAEIPPAGSEERERWLKEAERHYFTRWRGTYTADPEQVLALMSEARRQGQRDVLEAGVSDHTTASTPRGGDETLGASSETTGLSPDGHAPTGHEPSAVDPSRGPARPGVLWSAWSETDADSDPSDPGVTYCTEWFIGRWPIGADEPECRMLIGEGRTAEIIARRVAGKLTSILNTDRLRSGVHGWRADCFRTRMEEFDRAYKKACESSQPRDWMDAALLAQQLRNVAYAVLTGKAPKQEPPASVGWVLVPREPTDAMVQAGGSMLSPTHRLTDCYDYFREAWEAALDARPIPPSASATEAEGQDAASGLVHEGAARRETPEAPPSLSPDPITAARAVVEKIDLDDALEAAGAGHRGATPRSGSTNPSTVQSHQEKTGEVSRG